MRGLFTEAVLIPVEFMLSELSFANRCNRSDSTFFLLASISYFSLRFSRSLNSRIFTCSKS